MKSYDSFNSSSNGEGSETPVKKFEQFSKKVKSWKKKIAEHLGLSGKELTEATDEALVASVQETIATADEDGVRTEQEVADIQEAVETVVMQGAMEEAGFEESSGGNPILELDQAGTSGDLVAAVASPAVPNAHNIGMEAQRASKDVRDGFVADAFLANWDVIGLVYDNIVESDDGFYRIDNGGAMIFRAQGGPKEFSPDDIPELHSMLEHGSAKKVFGGITESEIRAQARDLLDKLSPEDIERIVQKSGLEGRERECVLSGLLGRREFLARNYGDAEQ